MTPDGSGALILDVLREWENASKKGAPQTVDGGSRRVRVLPLGAG